MKIYGLIGNPLSHSFSQRWFSDKFVREKLVDHRYELFPLEEADGLSNLLRQTDGLAGLNVTIPYKKDVIRLLDEVDPLASAVGAVNTIAMCNGRTVGHNTDVEGFRSTLLPLLDGKKPRALVLGSGGASRAVVYVLKELGIRFRVVSRSRERGDLTWDLLDPTVIKCCPLIINTTPLGMFPEVDSCPPLPYDSLGPAHILVDLVYNPEETLFLSNGRRMGSRTANGMCMLEAQAEASWRIWNGAAL
jgi:shikimate dehydrogenase